jgi:hypothetical protein
MITLLSLLLLVSAIQKIIHALARDYSTKPKAYIMLEYCSVVLQKVSFDPDLFSKELRKSIKMIKRDEVPVLKTWCIISYGDEYQEIIKEAFHNSRN